MAEPRPGSFVHVELASSDPQRTRAFLEKVFGWKFEAIPGTDYYPFATPIGPGGAVMPPSEDRPKGVLNYLLTEDLEGDLAKIATSGGRVLSPKKEIPGVGWWALSEEPGGCVLALFSPLSRSRGPVARYRT